MKKINFKIKNVKLAFVILIILAFIVLLLYYHFILTPSFAKSNFTNQMVEISDENENSIFNIQKILLYSSANAISNSKITKIIAYGDILINNNIFITKKALSLKASNKLPKNVDVFHVLAKKPSIKSVKKHNDDRMNVASPP